MGRRLIDDYNGRAAKKQDVTESARPNCPPPNGYKIVEYLDVYNGIARKGLAGTITTRVDRSNKTFIIERLMVRKERAVLTQERTEYAKMIRDGYEKGCVHARRRELKNLVPRKDGVSNTLTSVQKDNLLLEKKILSYSRDSNGEVVDRHVRDVAGTIHTKEGSCGNTAQFVLEPRIEQVANLVTGKEKFDNHIRGRDYSPEEKRFYSLYTNVSQRFARPPLADVSRTLKADCHNGVSDGFRIRKLTPRECFRLMDVSDADIDRIQASGVSRGQQYRMAGNSIVVSVLFHIFRKMFAEPSNDNGELELF